MRITIIIFLLAGIAAVIISTFLSRHFIKNITTTAFQGLTSLLAVNVIGLLTGVTISINWYTITSSIIFGIPSNIAILILDIILR